MMSWDLYVVILFALASVILAGGAYALHWAYRSGQFSHMKSGSESIFDEDEPMGQVTDRFPEKRHRRKSRQSENRSTLS